MKTRISTLGVAVLLGFFSLSAARSAHASPTFPADLQKALEKHFPGKTFCVPLCTACHLTTAGGPRNYNPFGFNMLANGLAAPISSVSDALEKELAVMPPLDSDKDGKSDSDELRDGDSPSLAEPRGVGEFCSDLKYGCGARIASSPPPVDKVGLFSAGLVLLGFAALLRRRQRAR